MIDSNAILLQPLVNARTTEARQTGSHFIQMEYVY